LYGETYDVILITESWLYSNIRNSLIDPHNLFTIVRHDRADVSVGGGTCTLIRKPLSVVKVMLDQSYSNLELCCFDMHCYEVNIRFIAVYRSPSFKCMKSLTSCMSNLSDRPTANPCIIAGDLNCANRDWSNLTAPSDGVKDVLLHFTLFNGLSLVVSVATRGNNILDVVISSEPLIVSCTEILPPFSNSDHSSVAFNISVDMLATYLTMETTAKNYMIGLMLTMEPSLSI